MKKMICYNCEKDLAEFTLRCPECGTYSPVKNVDADYFSKKRLSAKILPWVIVFGVLFLTVIVIRACGSMKQNNQNDPISAYSMAEVFVEKQLKAPKSADFAGYSDAVVKEIEPGVWLIKSYVDAQNSFGVQIRNNYIVKISYNPQTDNWKLLDIIIE